MDGQGTKCRRNIAENFNRLSRVHERYRQTDDRQTDGRAIAYSEREREFTFAKNVKNVFLHLCPRLLHDVIFSERVTFHRRLGWWVRSLDIWTQTDRPALEAPALHTLRLIARQPWRHCVASLRSAHWLASSLKLSARCPVSGCSSSCLFRHDHPQFGTVLRSLVVFSVPAWGGVVSAVMVSCNQLLLINSWQLENLFQYV